MGQSLGVSRCGSVAMGQSLWAGRSRSVAVGQSLRRLFPLLGALWVGCCVNSLGLGWLFVSVVVRKSWAPGGNLNRLLPYIGVRRKPKVRNVRI